MFTIQQAAQMLTEAIKQKIEKGQCLQCEAPASRQHRGLCRYHYDQFDNAKRAIKRATKRLTNAARAKFDDMVVTACQILPSRRGNRPKKPNPFKVFNQAS